MKAKFLIFFGLIGLAGWTSCNNDPGAEKRVEGLEVEGPISSIIRNPATANQPVDTVNVARIEFEQTEFDFGEVAEGEEVTHVFRFTNTGKMPLLITDARSTCGCTVPTVPKEPIPPGQGSEIKVVFNTRNRTGNQRKVVTITANTYPSQTKVALVGLVRGGQ